MVRLRANLIQNKVENKIEEPTACPVCGGEVAHKITVDSMTLACTNPACPGKLINRLDHFCGKKGLDMKGISKATLEKLIDWGWVSDFTDIFGDLFGDMFGGGRSRRASNGPMKGANVRTSVRITFEEAVFGAKKDISYQRVQRCYTCAGSGAAKGTSPKTCTACGHSFVKKKKMLSIPLWDWMKKNAKPLTLGLPLLLLVMTLVAAAFPVVDAEETL